jgi:hypothetical protein
MNAQDLVRKVFENSGEPSDIGAVFDAAGAVDWEGQGTVHLLAQLNHAQRVLAYYQDKFRRPLRFDCLYKQIHFTPWRVSTTLRSISSVASVQGDPVMDEGRYEVGPFDLNSSLFQWYGEILDDAFITIGSQTRRIVGFDPPVGTPATIMVITDQPFTGTIAVGATVILSRKTMRFTTNAGKRLFCIYHPDGIYTPSTVYDDKTGTELSEARKTKETYGAAPTVGPSTEWSRVGNSVTLGMLPQDVRPYTLWAWTFPTAMEEADDEPELPDTTHHAIALYAGYLESLRMEEYTDAQAAMDLLMVELQTIYAQNAVSKETRNVGLVPGKA